MPDNPQKPVATILTNVIQSITQIAVTLAVDEAELVAGQMVRVGGPALSVGGKSVYLYLSTDPNAVDANPATPAPAAATTATSLHEEHPA